MLSVLTGEEEEDPCYSPQKALTLALTDWLQEFLIPDHPGGRQGGTSAPVARVHEGHSSCSHPPGGLKKESADEEPMQTDLGESSYAPGAEEKPLYTAEPLRLDDLKLLSDLFYLPYEHGPTARTMLQELDWLKNHSAEEVCPALPEPVSSSSSVHVPCYCFQMAEWRSRALHFDDMCEAVVQMFNRLSNAPNRSIVYDLYSYICDIKSGLGLARAYVKTLGRNIHRVAPQLMS